MDSPSQKFKIIHNQLKLLVNEGCQDEQLLQKRMTKYIAQMVDGSDEEQQKMFDHFCEYGGSDILASLIKIDPLLAIKTYSLLFINLKNQMWVSFILCQPFLMQAISLKPHSHDQEYTQYFVSFLKSLSIRIDDAQVTLFYNKKNCTFPLAMAAMSYFNHPDFMVRTSVMNILLQLMKIKQEKTRQYFSRFPFTSYIILFACQINQLIHNFTIKIKENHQILTQKHFNSYQVDFSDYLYYLNDLIQFGSQKLVQIIENIIVSYIIIPIFHLIDDNDSLSKTHGLLLIYECLRVIKNRNILQTIVNLLLKVNISIQLKEVISNRKDIYKPFMFLKQFNSETSFWGEYEHQVIIHCLEVFRQIQKFDISFQEQTKQKNPKFYEQLKRICDFIGYDLLKDQVTSQTFSSKLMKNQQSQLTNPFRQILFSCLKDQSSQQYILCTSILVNIFKQTIVVQCLAQPISHNLVDKSVFYKSIIKQLISVLEAFMVKQLNWQKIRIKNICSSLNLLRCIVQQALSLDFQQDLLRNYKKVIQHLKEHIKAENMLFVIQNFFKTYRQVQNSIQKPCSDDVIPYCPIIRPYQDWNQQNKQYCLPQKNQQKTIYYSYIFFYIRGYVNHYFNKFYDVQYPNFEKEYQLTLFSTFSLWTVGNFYKITDRTLIVCQLQRKDQKKRIKVLIIEDQFNFVLAQLSDKQGCKILVNTSWKNMNFQLSKDDAALLEAILLSDDGNEKYKLYFEDQIRSNSTLVRLNDIKWECYEYQLSFINKFLKNAYEE